MSEKQRNFWVKRLAGFFAPRRSARHEVAGAWNTEHMDDEWFSSHFNYAADTVCAWLAPHVDFASARIVDFGCGDGITDLAIALKRHPAEMIGVDINPGFDSLPGLARAQIGLRSLPPGLRFEAIRPGQPLSGLMSADVLMTWSVFEHVARALLDPVVADLHDTLVPGGVMFLQVEPLFYGPFGSHLGRFIEQRWAHLELSDEALWERVRSHNEEIPAKEKEINFHSRSLDAYKRFVFEEYQKLNRLTADELVALFRRHGFRVLRQERRSVPWEPPAALLSRYPRELMTTNEILLLLQKAPVAQAA
ncbi:MAG: class I SAM-dependent methyltransferase [Rhodocyclaceae bacterium]|nr:class I SAM-dependent methyltransferase [Rhodocyclaceae bacterium]